MDAETIRAKYSVEPPEFGYRILAFNQPDPSTVEFSAILTERYDRVTEHGVDWSFSKYRCTSAKFVSLDLPIPELKEYDEQYLQMFWEPQRNCFLVDASAGFIFDCETIEVLDSSAEKLGFLDKVETREHSNPADG